MQQKVDSETLMLLLDGIIEKLGYGQIVSVVIKTSPVDTIELKKWLLLPRE